MKKASEILNDGLGNAPTNYLMLRTIADEFIGISKDVSALKEIQGLRGDILRASPHLEDL